MTKYETIISDICAQIASGALPFGKRLPTIPELCETYGVSKITVRRAMDELERKGLVTRKRGSGTYVQGSVSLLASGEDTFPGMQIEAFVVADDLSNYVLTNELHGFAIVEPRKDVAEALGISTQEPCYYFCRTRYVNERPECVEYCWIPVSVIPGLTKELLEGSLYRYMEQELGLKIKSAHRVVRAGNPTEDEARWLGIDANAPLLCIKQVTYLDDGTPFEATRSITSPDFELRVVSTR